MIDLSPERRPRWADAVARSCGLAAAAVGVADILYLGWVAPSATGVRVGAAVAVALAGVGLLLTLSTGGRKTLHALGIGSLVAGGVIGLVSAVGSVAALMVAATCAAVLVLPTRRLRWVGRTLAVAVLAAGGMAAVSHAYTTGLGDGTTFDFLPLPAALALVLLAGGGLLAHPGRRLSAVLSGTGVGGRTTRLLLPVVIALPLVLGWLRWQGERAGWYDTAFGLALFAVANAICLAAVLILAAGSLDRAEREAERSRERFRQLADALPPDRVGDRDGRHHHLPERPVGRVHRAARRGAGRHRRAAHPDDLGRMNAAWETARRSGQTFQAEYRLRPADGGPYRWFLARAVAVRGPGGEVLEWLGTSTDIDDLKGTEEALRENQRQFREVAESLPQLVWTDRADGYCDYLSPQWVRYTGIPEEEQLGYGWVNQLHPNDRGPAAAAWDRAAAAGTDFETEFRIRRADGAYRWFQTRAVPLRDAAGAVVKWFGTNTDIEDRKRAEADLTASRAMLQLVLDTIPHGVFWKDRDSRFLGCNRVVASAMGLAGPADIAGKSHADLSSITPEEADQFVRKDREVMDADAPRLHIVEPMTLADGRTIWLDTNKVPLHDDEGRVIGVLGTWEDVTERRRTEEARRESEERFHRTFDGMLEGCQIIGYDWRYLYVNDAVAAHARRSRAELVGRTMMEVYPGIEQTGVFAALRRCMEGRTPQRLENRFVYPDGHAAWFDLSVQPGPEGLFVLSADITARKAAEEELQASQARLNSALAAGSIGTWTWDIANDRLTADEFTARVFGIEPAAAANGLPAAAYLRAVLEDDQPGVADALARAIESCGHYDIEYRVGPHDGELRWLQAKGRVEGDAAGNAVTFHGAVTDITGRKRTEGRFRRLVDSNVQGVIFWNANGDITGANDAFLRIVGYTREDLEAGRVGWAAMTPPEYAHLDRHALAEVAARGVCAPFEKEYVRKDGSRVPILLGAAAFEDTPNEGVSFVIDISERKQADRALRESEERFRGAFERTNVAMVLTDIDNRFLQVNEAFTRLFGYTEAELLTMGLAELTHPDHLAESLANRREILARGTNHFEMEKRYLRKDGRVLWGRTNVALVRDADGRTLHYVGQVQDITERKRAEVEVRRLNAELEDRVAERTAQLEAANKELEAFSYSVSHDLRAPLRAIDGFSRIVEEDFGPHLPAEGREYLRDVRANTRHMGRLVDDLLAFSRLGRKPVARQPVASADLVRDCLAEMLASWAGRPADVRVGDLPDCEADPALVKQVWLNLLSNALQYTGKREAAVIEIGGTDTPDGPTYFVRDNGVGFDMRYAHKLFGVFQRLHRTEEYEGTGVGLAIVQRIVHRHGGRIWAEAELDRGATFFFTLPSSERAILADEGSVKGDDCPDPPPDGGSLHG